MGAANAAPFLGLKNYVFFLRKLIFKESCITIGLVKNVTLYPKSGPSAKLWEEKKNGFKSGPSAKLWEEEEKRTGSKNRAKL